MRWIEYTKLSNGQSVVICFDKNYRHEIGSGYDYAVAFAIANKKKVLRQWLNSDGYGDLDMTTTGKCGVEGLLWAFKMVREFIGTHMYENDRIIVYGSDARRQKVYRHFLTTRLGFEEILDPYWGRCLAKTYKQTKINVDTIIKMWYLIYKEKHN